MEKSWKALKIFLDSSVLLSAAGSRHSLSRLIVSIAVERQWSLITSRYCRSEVERNVIKFGSVGIEGWRNISPEIALVADAYTSKRPLLLATAKDKPVLISALAARSHYLLTLDKHDFGIVLDADVYGMHVTTPRGFLIRQGLG